MSCDADASPVASATAPTIHRCFRPSSDASEQQAEHRQHHLGQCHPPAPASPERRHVPVHQRRPHHLERPGGLGQRKQPHEADVDADVTHPVGYREPDEAEREAGGERQQRDRSRSRRAQGAREIGERPGRGSRLRWPLQAIDARPDATLGLRSRGHPCSPR